MNDCYTDRGGSEPVVQDMMQDIVDFHVKFGQEYNGKPRMLPASLFDFRSKFHLEEITEYEDEQDILEDEAGMEEQDEDVIIGALERQLDALCDGAYVILGTAYLQFGADRFREAWKRVVKANMAKVLAGTVEGSVDSGRAAEHDVVKPPGWVAPDHKDLVRDYDAASIKR